MFIHHKLKVETILEAASNTQIKLTRATCEDGTHTKRPNSGVVWEKIGNGNQTSCFNSSGGDLTLFFSDKKPPNEWESYFNYLDLGTVDTRDGSRFIKAIGVDDWVRSSFQGENYQSVSNDGIGGAGKNPTSWLPTGNILNLESTADQNFIRYILLPFFKRAEDAYNIWVDQFWVNDSLESVYLSPHSTWSVAKADFDSLVIQPMNSRTTGAIEISCEEGDLGATRYLYVMNENGQVNETGVSL